MLGITCTSILVVSVFGAAAADPHRKHLPLQVTQIVLLDMSKSNYHQTFLDACCPGILQN